MWDGDDSDVMIFSLYLVSGWYHDFINLMRAHPQNNESFSCAWLVGSIETLLISLFNSRHWLKKMPDITKKELKNYRDLFVCLAGLDLTALCANSTQFQETLCESQELKKNRLSRVQLLYLLIITCELWQNYHCAGICCKLNELFSV